MENKKDTFFDLLDDNAIVALEVNRRIMGIGILEKYDNDRYKVEHALFQFSEIFGIFDKPYKNTICCLR